MNGYPFRYSHVRRDEPDLSWTSLQIIKEGDHTVSQPDPITRRRVCVRGIIYKDGNILVQELINNKGEGRGFFCTPGGGVDPQEDLVSALRREMIEETGVAPVVGNLLFVQQFADTGNHGEDEQLEFFFAILNPDDYTQINLSQTTHGQAEMLSCEFVDQKTSNIYPTFLRDVDIDAYLAGAQPVLIWNALGKKIALQ